MVTEWIVAIRLYDLIILELQIKSNARDRLLCDVYNSFDHLYQYNKWIR